MHSKERIMIMNNQKYVPKMPDIMEAIFDTCYLLFDLVAGVIFLQTQMAKCYLLYMVS